MGQETSFLIDRRNDYWRIPPNALHFPLESEETLFHQDTLVDGELVMDNLGGGQLQPKFLVFDCLVLDGKDLMERTLDKRLAYFKAGVFEPYRTLFRKYPQEEQFQAFKLEMKDMQFSYGIEMMFREVLPNLKHGNDGLIFTCRNTQYQPGTDQHILKWKPAEENTIDFRIHLDFAPVDLTDTAAGENQPYMDYDNIPTASLLTFHGNNSARPYQHFATLHITEDEWELIKGFNDPISNRVVECALDEQQRWRIHRFRDDKAEANHINTVNSVLDSIKDGVSEQELLDAAKAIKDNWKARQAQQQQRR
jgi:mRNA guanylyltransferase